MDKRMMMERWCDRSETYMVSGRRCPHVDKVPDGINAVVTIHGLKCTCGATRLGLTEQPGRFALIPDHTVP